MEYKLSGVDRLQLSGETLAKIYAGTVKSWDDPAVKADNAGVTLPATPITVIHRSDGSGTTAAFTAYLQAVAPNVWTAGSAKDVSWPVGQGAKGSDGVTSAVRAGEGTIGYAELSYAKGTGTATAHIRNASGAYVAPDAPTGVASALAEATVPDNLNIGVNYAPKAADAYPLSTVTYAVVAEQPADGTKAALLKSFLTYALGDGQRAAAGLQYAPLPEKILDPAKAATATLGTG